VLVEQYYASAGHKTQGPKRLRKPDLLRDWNSNGRFFGIEVTWEEAYGDSQEKVRDGKGANRHLGKDCLTDAGEYR